jgi:phage-related baseplate assembly protein
MLTPPTYLELLDRLVAHTRASSEVLTDFNVGSVTRAWLEAAAIGLDEVWMGAAQAVDAAIPEAVFQSFSFTRAPAVYATGRLTFTLSAPKSEALPIPAGTTVRQLGGTLTFVTLADGAIPAGQTQVVVLARAMDAGAASNTAADTLTVITSTGVATPTLAVTNIDAITNGRDAETDAERRLRFAQWVATLARGTVAAYRYAAWQATVRIDDAIVERVNTVAIVERPGLVDLYVHNGTGDTSDALLAAVSALIEGDDTRPGYRAAGSQVAYHAAIDVPLTVTATVDLEPGYTLNAVRTGLTSVLRALVLQAGDAISVPEIINAGYTVPGVANLNLLAPVVRTTYNVVQRPTLGTLTLTAGA